MKQYHDALQTILRDGTVRPNRTGTDTIGVFGLQSRYPLADGFPLVTTKKIFWKGVVHELLWFLRGETNIKPLVDVGVNIWNAWPLRHFNKVNGTDWTESEFIDAIKVMGDGFAARWGELGPVYGSQWRRWPDPQLYDATGEWSPGHIDQIAKLMSDLKSNPYGRRHIVTAWNPAELEEMEVSGLPPCHCLFQFNCREVPAEAQLAWQMARVKQDESSKEWVVMVDAPQYYLDCQLYQRSCDFFLGVPFNIASYALLTHMIAHQLNMIPGDFVHTYGDAHIYVNHIAAVKEQLSREPRPLPTLEIADYGEQSGSCPPDIFSYEPEQFMLKGYDPHPAIKGQVAV